MRTARVDVVDRSRWDCGAQSQSCQFSQDIPSNTPETTCVCSGFRGKQPKVRGALLAAFAKDLGLLRPSL